MPSERLVGGCGALVIVDGDVDVNGDGDEKHNSGLATTERGLLSLQKLDAYYCVIPGFAAETIVAVAVAVHVNVAVNDHGRSAPLTDS